MSYSEDDLLPVSAIQHLLFCERQCALIHLEHIWDENVLTAEGRHQHDRCDEMTSETRGDVLIARGLYIQNLELGLTGKADVVEFHLRKTPRRFTKHMRLVPKRNRRGDNDRASVPEPFALLGEATG